MPADVLFLITVAGLAMIHFSAVQHAWAVWDGRTRGAAGYMLLGMLGWIIVVAVVAVSLNWGTL